METMKEEKYIQDTSVPSTRSMNDQSGWFSKPVLKQGFFMSIAMQFFVLAVPFTGWKVVVYPGMLNAYMDIIIVFIVAIIMIAIVAIIMAVRMHTTDPTLLPGKLTRMMQVTAIIGNLAGNIFVIYSIITGFKYALLLGSLPNLSFNTDGVVPYLLLAIATSMQGCVVIVAWRCFKWQGPASKVIAWAIVFSCIPAGIGLLFTIDPLYGGAMPAAMFASSVMLGVSAFWLESGDIAVLENRDTAAIKDITSTEAVEIKGTNITGFLFLLAMLLFNFTSPLMNPSGLMLPDQALLVISSIAIAAGIVVVGNWLGIKTLKARLYAAIIINFDAAAVTYILDISDPLRAIALAIMIGFAAGLVLEPVIRSFLKFNLTRRGFAKIITTVFLGMFFSVLFMLLSTAFITQHVSLVPYGNIVFPIMLLLATVPAVFSANYSTTLEFEGKKKPISWILHAALIVNFFMIVLLIVFPVFAQL